MTHNTESLHKIVIIPIEIKGLTKTTFYLFIFLKQTITGKKTRSPEKTMTKSEKTKLEVQLKKIRLIPKLISQIGYKKHR